MTIQWILHKLTRLIYRFSFWFTTYSDHQHFSEFHGDADTIKSFIGIHQNWMHEPKSSAQYLSNGKWNKKQLLKTKYFALYVFAFYCLNIRRYFLAHAFRLFHAMFYGEILNFSVTLYAMSHKHKYTYITGIVWTLLFRQLVRIGIR